MLAICDCSAASCSCSVAIFVALDPGLVSFQSYARLKEWEREFGGRKGGRLVVIEKLE